MASTATSKNRPLSSGGFFLFCRSPRLICVFASESSRNRNGDRVPSSRRVIDIRPSLFSSGARNGAFTMAKLNRKDLLKETIKHIDIKEHPGILQVVDSMQHMAF